MAVAQLHRLLIVATDLYLLTVSLAIPWWSPMAQLSLHENPEIYFLAVKPLCSQLPGLSPGQTRVCELFMDHMPAVAIGARQAIEECQYQFQTRRWNCSTPYGSGVFGPEHKLGTKEAAFTYAVVSAGVAHEVGKSCRSGTLTTCSCSTEKRPKDLKPEWMWGGCGDNVDYGYEFASNFIDVRERELNHNKKSSDYARSLMNRWNNEIGRKLVKRKAKVNCKCHGVSGSCNLKTCWKQLAPVREVGDVLLNKYDSAVQVRVNKRGNLQVVERHSLPSLLSNADSSRRKRAPKMDLVYLDESPDFCSPNDHTGTLGTKGRLCSKNSTGQDSCELMCCGRGHNTFTQVLTEKCKCKFEWCCKVVCRTCQTEVETHVCK